MKSQSQRYTMGRGLDTIPSPKPHVLMWMEFNMEQGLHSGLVALFV